MSIWESFSEEELLFIANCGELKDIKSRFKDRYDSEAWIMSARESYTIHQDTNQTIDSLFLSINEANNYSIFMLLAIIGSITVELIPLTILTIVTILLSVGVGTTFLTYAFRQHRDECMETQKEMDFNAIRILCAEEYIRKKEKQLASANVPVPAPAVYKAYEYKDKDKHKQTRMKPAVTAGLLVTSVLFCTYYSGLAILLHAFGAVAISSIMLGPIGISIALGVALLIGVGLGYLHYKALTKQDNIEQFKTYQTDLLRDKRHECASLKKKGKQHTVTQTHIVDTHQKPDFSHTYSCHPERSEGPPRETVQSEEVLRCAQDDIHVPAHSPAPFRP